MTALLKNVFFVKLDEIVGKYTNRYKRKKLKTYQCYVKYLC